MAVAELVQGTGREELPQRRLGRELVTLDGARGTADAQRALAGGRRRVRPAGRVWGPAPSLS